QPGDLLLFRRSRSGRVFHVALVTANRGGRIRMIHSTSSRGVVEEELQASSYWRSKHATARSVAHLRR
ncbi:MAG: NlpC/P60 family protein, partial [Bacteroidetes bacterium]